MIMERCWSERYRRRRSETKFVSVIFQHSVFAPQQTLQRLTRYVVWGSNRHFFWESFKTGKCIMWARFSDFLILNTVVLINQWTDRRVRCHSKMQNISLSSALILQIKTNAYDLISVFWVTRPCIYTLGHFYLGKGCNIANRQNIGLLWHNTRWFKYYRDYLCVNKSQFVLVIFEPPCT
jgi:hypothetical protein